MSRGMRFGETHANVMIPPKSQNISAPPTLSVFEMMVEGVEKMPVPITRLMMSSAVEKTPSFRSGYAVYPC